MLDELRQAVNARVVRAFEGEQLDLLLEPEALQEAERLAQAISEGAGGTAEHSSARLVLGSFLWGRHLALGSPGFSPDRDAAISWLAPYVAAGGDPDAVPAPLLDEVVNAAARTASDLVPESVDSHPPEVVDSAITTLRHVVAACPEAHPNLAAMLTNLGTALKFRSERTSSVPDVDEAIAFLRRAVEVTPADHAMRAGRLFNLAIAISHRFNLTHADEDLDDSLKGFTDTLDAMAPDDPERPAVHEYLGSVFRARAARRSPSFGQAAFVER
ncbi:hypothetical protein, partial [Lentzea sp.]|uniref:hypothetical protein n=1 Tax=Lentzea sp. TaxID=56099 RepID=UPI002ED0DF2E